MPYPEGRSMSVWRQEAEPRHEAEQEAERGILSTEHSPYGCKYQEHKALPLLLYVAFKRRNLGEGYHHDTSKHLQ